MGYVVSSTGVNDPGARETFLEVLKHWNLICSNKVELFQTQDRNIFFVIWEILFNRDPTFPYFSLLLVYINLYNRFFPWVSIRERFISLNIVLELNFNGKIKAIPMREQSTRTHRMAP